MKLAEIVTNLQALNTPENLKRTIGHLAMEAVTADRSRTDEAWTLTDKEQAWLKQQGFTLTPMYDNSTDFVTDVHPIRKGEKANCWIIAWPAPAKPKGMDPKKLRVGARYWYERDGEGLAVEVLRDPENDGKYLHPVKAGIEPGTPVLGRWDYRYDFGHLVRKLMKPKR